MLTMDFSSSLTRSPRIQVGIEGVLWALIPVPFLFLFQESGSAAPPFWSVLAAAIASLAALGAAVVLLQTTWLGKIFGYAALAGCAVAGFSYCTSDPLVALLSAVTLIQTWYVLSEFQAPAHPAHRHPVPTRRLQRARSALWTLLPVTLASLVLPPQQPTVGATVATVSLLICQCLVVHWIGSQYHGMARIVRILLPMAASMLSLAALMTESPQPVAICLGLATLACLPRVQSGLEHREQWWEPFLNHPARILISTFFGLCLAGTLLLQLPWATSKRTIAFVDAAFTSVSAVCVTGLTVLDTPGDFTLLGQGCILLLIQLGGFGIMTITTVSLHIMGKRLSLRQERLLTTMTETSHLDLIDSLLTIVRFTLLAELAGGVLLTCFFFFSGDTLPHAAWKGLFTAISAFCNAGFALHSTNLMPYQSNPFILHTVATLIILGGLAPATCLILPAWLRGRRIELAPRIALVTTTILLLSGTLCFLLFEWDNTLAGLSVSDKFHNAWFQSVTLRTAGFNSVDLGNVLSPTFLVMLGFMFIGGSPGGTAGGIKTTTVGLLAMTFWATITGKNDIIAQNRRIPQAIVNRAITVFGSGVLIWFVAVLAVAITHTLPARVLIFEVTSALGTVGLSLGATPHLDVMGKIIIMLTMFIGRIGPMTLFTLLSVDIQSTESRCPDARITLT